MSEARNGPCFFCGQPGQYCPLCGVYLCSTHDRAYYLRAKAATKKAGTAVVSTVRAVTKKLLGPPVPGGLSR